MLDCPNCATTLRRALFARASAVGIFGQNNIGVVCVLEALMAYSTSVFTSGKTVIRCNSDIGDADLKTTSDSKAFQSHSSTMASEELNRCFNSLQTRSPSQAATRFKGPG